MTVIQLECFMEVYQQKNFSKAAANLYLSQPTLSRHIQSLEEELRATLFIRANNVIRLTAIGQALFPALEHLYQEIQAATAEIHEIVDKHTGLFRIGIAASLQLQDEYRRAMQEVKEQHPNANIRVCHLSMNKIYEALMSGTVDVLFALDSFVPPSDKVHSHALYTDNMCLAVPAGHPNAGLDMIEHGEIEEKFPELNLCMLDAGAFEPEVQEGLKTSMDSYEYSQDVVMVPTSDYDMEDILLMVDSGMGITCINEHCDLKSKEHVRLIPLVDRTPEGVQYRQNTVGVYWIDKSYSPLLGSFLSALKRQYEA